ncbi:3'-5' exonuclease [Sphingobium fluviale]|uniref:3'-5' exonuclease n=1 Tax=Sphingobium fluviale TaxID=2506423 RepID=UPI001FE67196|nr:3'-5' exonuclease [Sphingobium fluviale]
MVSDSSLEALAAHLEASGNYRVLRRLPDPPDPPSSFVPMPHLKRAIFLDVETTGLDPNQDEIIELAMVPFWYDGADRVVGIGSPLTGLRQPMKSIPAEVQRLTGITDAMVYGHAIDPRMIAAFATDSLIIAHNAAFDRRFVERFCPQLADNPWACSMAEIPWAMHGFESTKLSLLGLARGFYYDGHRAVHDCHAGIELLSRALPLGSGDSALKSLLMSARSTTWRCWAINSPFDKKDILKARGYRWADGSDGMPKAWWIDIDEAAFPGEMAFLRTSIYGRSIQISMSTLNAFNRYSDRLNVTGYALP